MQQYKKRFPHTAPKIALPTEQTSGFTLQRARKSITSFAATSGPQTLRDKVRLHLHFINSIFVNSTYPLDEIKQQINLSLPPPTHTQSEILAC